MHIRDLREKSFRLVYGSMKSGKKFVASPPETAGEDDRSLAPASLHVLGFLPCGPADCVFAWLFHWFMCV